MREPSDGGRHVGRTCCGDDLVPPPGTGAPPPPAAEATVPAFGATMTTGIKSLAGGKAVALVWRDPYPFQYDKENDTWYKKGQKAWYKSDTGNNYHRVSPWYQYDVDGSKDEMSTDGGAIRYDGYHEMRVLYFKQLNN